MKNNEERKLTAKQERFVEEYLMDLNGTQAYIRSYGHKGYIPSVKTAEVEGFKNLRKPKIQKAIQKARKKLLQRTEVTQERVIAELARLAFMDPREFFDEDGSLKDIHQLSDDAAAAIAGMDISTDVIGRGDDKEFSITKKIKLTRKEKALELLGKHLGLFDERLTLNFSSEVLNALLSGLPDEFAGKVRETLGQLISRKRD